jgi:hypothetical protein
LLVTFEDEDRVSLAFEQGPSSFSRTGFGLWDSIKPEVVEFGGDDVVSKSGAPSLTAPPEVCPELVRSTFGGGPAYGRDVIGTSFAAPMVTHIAGQIAHLFPDRSTQLYRALIVNSARWPAWADTKPVPQRLKFVRSIGYGVPSVERATENAVNRVTLITESEFVIHAKEGFVFGVPIPEELRRPGEEFDVRIDLTLSYVAEPRRTRKGRRGYLGVWLDWKASKRQEDFDTFQARALKVSDTEDETGAGGTINFPWTLGNAREKDGATEGLSRKHGTVQKDWAIVKSFELPNIFGIIVRGHEGWARRNPEATAKFSLVVSFEAIGTDLPVYEAIRQAISVEDAEIESGAKIEADVAATNFRLN